VLGGFWEAKHPTDDSAAVEAPAQVTHLPPSPSMLHFHHTLRDQGLLLGGREDWPQTNLLNLNPTVPLRGEKGDNENES